MNLNMSCASKLFDDDTLEVGLKDLEGRETIDQDELITFLWRQSVANFLKAKKSGRKSVLFDPVFIKFAVYLRSKVNTGTYKFMSHVFNLPSERTLSNYDTLDGQSKEGLLRDTLWEIEDEME